MRETLGPQRLVVLEVWPGGAVDAYRIVRSDNPEDPVFVNSFKSHYELGEAPRRVERSSAVIYMGISAYFRGVDAHATARIFPKLGDYIAKFALVPGFGFNFAHTGHPGHLTIWADPVKLIEVVTDIEPVS